MTEERSIRIRREYKYFLDEAQDALARLKADCMLLRDPHGDTDGSYFVSSLYLDSLDDSCLNDSILNNELRSKYRIRCYNSDPSRLFLEKKSKNYGFSYKEVIPISAEECRCILSGEVPKLQSSDSELRKKLLTELFIRSLMPKLIVSYDRAAYTYDAGGLRLTVDRNLSSSSDFDAFLSGDYVRRPVMSPGKSLLEIKWSGLIPQHIYDAFCLDSLTRTAFSKYLICRTYHL